MQPCPVNIITCSVYDTVTFTAGRILSRRSRSRSKADRHLAYILSLAIRSRTRPGRQPSIFNAVTALQSLGIYNTSLRNKKLFKKYHNKMRALIALYRLSHAVATASRQSKVTIKK